MTPKPVRNSFLALIALGALAIYILACTSFSPDDKKIVYTAFDPGGAIGVAVYDREAKKNNIVFIPYGYATSGSNHVTVTGRYIRSQWLPDGKRLLVAWAGGEDQEDDQLEFAVVPLGSGAPVKVFRFRNVKEAATRLVIPFAVSGDNVLLPAEDGTVVRLDLRDGSVAAKTIPGEGRDFWVYPSPRGEGAFYVRQSEEGDTVTFGRIDPERLTTVALATLPKIDDGSFFAYNSQGSRVALVIKSNDLQYLQVVENGKPIVQRPLDNKDARLSFGNAVLSLRGDRLWASFERRTSSTNSSYGLMEIPCSQDPIKETVLVRNLQTSGGDDLGRLFFQVSISHDGKTAALCSTYLACMSEKIEPEDCALFLVDLSDPKRTVTRVPVPLPSKPLTGFR